MNRAAMLKDISASVENFVHEVSDRRILNSILGHANELFDENEQLQQILENNRFEIENLRHNIARLEVFKQIYMDRVRRKDFKLNNEVQTMSKPYYKTCFNCGANLDPDEKCDCVDPSIIGKATETSRPILNAHGEYVVKFATNHGISISEAYAHPTVKAHLVAYNALFKDDRLAIPLLKDLC